MHTIDLPHSSRAALIQALASTSTPDVVHLTIHDDGQLTMQINDQPWSDPIGTAQPQPRPVLYPYIDLSTCHLPQNEKRDIDSAPVTTVITHPDGAWIQIPFDLPDSTSGEWAAFPALLQVLRRARTRGAHWINFDCAGVDTFEDLPTYD
jgi:hypothetical protein